LAGRTSHGKIPVPKRQRRKRQEKKKQNERKERISKRGVTDHPSWRGGEKKPRIRGRALFPPKRKSNPKEINERGLWTPYVRGMAPPNVKNWEKARKLAI